MADIDLEPILTGEQMRLLQDVSQILLGEVGESADVYPGKIVPSADPLQQEAYDMAQGLVGSGAASDRMTALSRALTGDVGYDTSPTRYLEGFRGNVEEPMLAQWEKYKARELKHKYGSAGDTGSLDAILASSFASDVLGPIGALRQEALMRGLTAEEQAMGAARDRSVSAIMPSIAAEYAPIEEALNVGGSRRSIAAEQSAEAYNKWLQGQAWNNPWMSQYLPLALGTSAYVPVTDTGGSDIGGILGGTGSLLGGIGMLAAAFCHGAAVYFGWFTPQWFAAWRWINFGWNDATGLAFRAWYQRNSRQLAALLRVNRELRDKLSPIFEWAAKMGGASHG